MTLKFKKYIVSSDKRKKEKGKGLHTCNLTKCTGTVKSLLHLMTFILELVHLTKKEHFTKKGLNTLLCFNYIARRASLCCLQFACGKVGEVKYFVCS